MKPVKIIALLLRFTLSYVFLLLSYRHYFIPEIFRRTLELPVDQGILFVWLYQPILDNITLFNTVRIIFATIELILGIGLLFGVFIRLIAVISTILLIIIILGLIPSWFMVFVHLTTLFFSIPLIFIDASDYSLNKYIPNKLLFLQRP